MKDDPPLGTVAATEYARAVSLSHPQWEAWQMAADAVVVTLWDRLTDELPYSSGQIAAAWRRSKDARPLNRPDSKPGGE